MCKILVKNTFPGSEKTIEISLKVDEGEIVYIEHAFFIKFVLAK